MNSQKKDTELSDRLTSAAFVELRNLGVSFGARRILSNINLSIQSGELVAIVGPNGVGKSTLVRAMLGLIPSESESRKLFGLSNPLLSELSGRVVYIPQRFQLNRLVPMSVGEFLGLKGGEILSWLKKLDLDPSISKQSIHEISGGELQRVLLAFALMGAPDLICLDEGAEGIDPRAQEVAFHLLNEEVTKGKSVLFVSHDISAVSRFARRVVCLGEGVGYDGRPSDPSFHSCLHKMYGEGSFIHDHSHHQHDHHYSADLKKGET